MLLSSPLQALGYSGFGSKLSSQKEEIADGVSLIQETYQNGTTQRAIQVLDVAYSKPSVSLELYHPTPLGRLQTTTAQAFANTYDNHYVVGAINGGFVPMNMIVRNNEILHFGVTSKDADGPVFHKAAFGLNRDGQPVVADVNPVISFTHNGATYNVDSVNSTRETDKIVLYTPSENRTTTNTNQWGTEIVVVAESGSDSFKFGSQLTGTVTKVTRLGQAGNSTIPENGFVLSIQGKTLSDQFLSVKEGESISVQASINNEWKDAQFMLATGPTLVRNGAQSISMNLTSSFATTAHPRTAIGVSKDGSRVYLVTLDGRQSGYSNGATLQDFANYLISLGVHNAINLDGGGSTTMVARLPYYQNATLINRPSDGVERGVPTTLQVISTEKPKKLEINDPMLMISSLDRMTGWQATAARAEVSLSESKGTARLGEGALKLTYDYTKGETGTAAAYLKASPAREILGMPQELGLWAFGDGREHWLRGTIMDGSGQRHTINFTQEHAFNWTGWKYVRAKLPSNLPTPIKLEQVYIAQSVASKQGKGQVYFDQIEAIYQQSYQVQRFSDVKASFWGYESILNLNDLNVISGFNDGTFKPNDSITREQTAIMIARALNLSANGQKTALKDVKQDSFYYDAIVAVEKAGIMTGKTSDTFSPQEKLTRAEMAVILQRAYRLTGSTDNPFPDVKPSHWAFKAIDALKSNQLANGLPDGTYGLNKVTTRAEFSAFLDRARQQ